MPSEHSPFGPSSLKRLELCPGSYRLSSLVRDGFDATTPEAERGTRIHSEIERYIKARNENEPFSCSLDDDERDVFEKYAAYVDGLFADYHASITPEERLEYHDFNGLLFFGTADVVIEAPDYDIIVDWKTGYRKVDPAWENLQGAAYALARWQQVRRPVLVKFVNLAIGDISEYLFESPCYLAGRITSIIDAANADDAPLKMGEEQCRYCKAAMAGTCPLFTGSANALASDSIKPIFEMSDDELGKAVEIGRIAAKFAENAEAEMKRRLETQNEVAGWTIKPSSGGREASDVIALYEVLKDDFDQYEFLGVCKPSLSALEKIFTERRSADGLMTKKDASMLFKNLTAECTVEKPERKTLIKTKAKAAG